MVPGQRLQCLMLTLEFIRVSSTEVFGIPVLFDKMRCVCIYIKIVHFLAVLTKINNNSRCNHRFFSFSFQPSSLSFLSLMISTFQNLPAKVQQCTLFICFHEYKNYLLMYQKCLNCIYLLFSRKLSGYMH